jgi:hypothetical protein
MSESWLGLITDSVAHLPIFSMLTHTHVSDNRSKSYSRLSTAHVRSSMGRTKSEAQTIWRSCHGFGQRRLHLLLLLIRFIY